MQQYHSIPATHSLRRFDPEKAPPKGSPTQKKKGNYILFDPVKRVTFELAFKKKTKINPARDDYALRALRICLVCLRTEASFIRQSYKPSSARWANHHSGNKHR